MRRARLRRAANIVIAVTLLLIVGWVLRDRLRGLTLADVATALRTLPVYRLAGCAVLTVLNYLALSLNDVLGVRHVEHGRGTRRIGTLEVLRYSFVTYAMTFNFGAFIGSFAMRFRLYARAGFTVGEVTLLIAFCMLTKWLGFFIVAGVVYSLWPLPLPESVPGDWPLDELRLVGLLLLAVPALYVVACAVWRGSLAWRGVPLRLPRWPTALVQCAASTVEWILAGAIVYLVLPTADIVTLPRVLGIYLLTAVAGVLTHVPGGLGVFEALFLGFLAPPLPASLLLVRLLAYRVIYYLAPLLAAVVLYAWSEASRRRRRFCMTPDAGGCHACLDVRPNLQDPA